MFSNEIECIVVCMMMIKESSTIGVKLRITQRSKVLSLMYILICWWGRKMAERNEIYYFKAFTTSWIKFSKGIMTLFYVIHVSLLEYSVIFHFQVYNFSMVIYKEFKGIV